MVDNQVCLHAGTHAAESLHAYQLISIDLIVFLLCEKTLDFEWYFHIVRILEPML